MNLASDFGRELLGSHTAQQEAAARGLGQRGAFGGGFGAFGSTPAGSRSARAAMAMKPSMTQFSESISGGSQYDSGWSGWGTQDSNMSETSARQIATLQAKLSQRLGPEYISQRPGPGGGPKMTYMEGWKAIDLANEVFGFNGWSTSITRLDVDYMDIHSEGHRVNVGVSCIVRVTLRDGVYHEDVGFGNVDNAKTKAMALEKCKKEAVTDSLKRTLRTFGKLLGNCLYDKSYTSEVLKIKVPVAKFDGSQLHRRPEFAQPPQPQQQPQAEGQAQASTSAAPHKPANAPAAVPSGQPMGPPQQPLRSATTPSAAASSSVQNQNLPHQQPAQHFQNQHQQPAQQSHIQQHQQARHQQAQEKRAVQQQSAQQQAPRQQAQPQRPWQNGGTDRPPGGVGQNRPGMAKPAHGVINPLTRPKTADMFDECDDEDMLQAFNEYDDTSDFIDAEMDDSGVAFTDGGVNGEEQTAIRVKQEAMGAPPVTEARPPQRESRQAAAQAVNHGAGAERPVGNAPPPRANPAARGGPTMDRAASASSGPTQTGAPHAPIQRAPSLGRFQFPHNESGATSLSAASGAGAARASPVPAGAMNSASPATNRPVIDKSTSAPVRRNGTVLPRRGTGLVLSPNGSPNTNDNTYSPESGSNGNGGQPQPNGGHPGFKRASTGISRPGGGGGGFGSALEMQGVQAGSKPGSGSGSVQGTPVGHGFMSARGIKRAAGGEPGPMPGGPERSLSFSAAATSSSSSSSPGQQRQPLAPLDMDSEGSVKRYRPEGM